MKEVVKQRGGGERERRERGVKKRTRVKCHSQRDLPHCPFSPLMSTSRVSEGKGSPAKLKWKQSTQEWKQSPVSASSGGTGDGTQDYRTFQEAYTQGCSLAFSAGPALVKAKAHAILPQSL